LIEADYLETLKQQISDLETELTSLSVSGNTQGLQQAMRQHSMKKKTLEQAEVFLTLRQRKAEALDMLDPEKGDPEMAEMATEELRALEEELPRAERTLQVALLPADAAEEKNTIVEIRAGTGGDEAALFAADLFRMYSRLAENSGWKLSVLNSSPSTIGGYKEVIFSIEGDYIFRRLQYESGVHRVQRVPATEASGRIHTSAATVAVLPEADEVDEIDLKPEEIRIDVYRSSGPGGQSVNTTDSAVRITHLETGIIVQCQDEKSQHKNKAQAMRVMKARLLDRYRSEEASKAADARRSQIGSGDRSERIRTYNFPQNRLTDHRINLTLYSLDRIMEGDMTELLDALYERDLEDRLALHLGKATA
jgi:peptide chain release factor 1